MCVCVCARTCMIISVCIFVCLCVLLSSPQGRLVGVLLLDVALLASMGVSVYSTFVAAGGVAGAMALFADVITLNLWV